jgi:hypothetical protein
MVVALARGMDATQTGRIEMPEFKKSMSAKEVLSACKHNNIKGTIVRRFKRTILVSYDCPVYGTVKIKATEAEQNI